MFESKRRAFIFMLASIFLALVAVILFSDYIAQTKASLGEMTTVLVAKEDIGAGKPIADNMVTEKEIPKKYMLDSLIQSRSDLKGKISMVPIPRGSAITSPMLRKNTIVTGENRQVMLRAPLAIFDDQIDTLDKVDLVASFDAQPGPGEPSKQDKRTTKVLFRDVTVSRVDKKGDEIVAIGVVLSLADAKEAIWALNYGKEIRVLKSGSAKAPLDTANAEDNKTEGTEQTQMPTPQPQSQAKQQAPAKQQAKDAKNSTAPKAGQSQKQTPQSRPPAGKQAPAPSPAKPKGGQQGNGGS